MKRAGKVKKMATIKIQPATGEARFLQNASIVNGVVVTGEAGKYTPYFNRVLIQKTGKETAARQAPRQMSAAKIAEWADVMFHIGENEGGYTVSFFVAEKAKPVNRRHNSIFGASSDGGY